jgi:hypothetical protein
MKPPHDWPMTEIRSSAILPLSGDLGARVLGLGPRDRSAQVVRGSASHPRLGGRCHHHKPMGRDRRQEARIAIAVDRAAAIAPDDQRQRVLAREWREVRRSIDDVTWRVEGGPDSIL